MQSEKQITIAKNMYSNSLIYRVAPEHRKEQKKS